jgi:hypothetical protein
LDILITLLFALATILVVVTLVGYGTWLLLQWIFRQLTGPTVSQPNIRNSAPFRCQNCNLELSPNAVFCGHCGWRKSEGTVVELVKDLAATERQIQRFHRAGALDDDSYEKLKAEIDQERRKLDLRGGRAPAAAVSSVDTPGESTQRQPASVTQSVAEEAVSPLTERPSSVVTASFVATDEKIVIDPTPSFLPPHQVNASPPSASSGPVRRTFIPPRQPRRSFAEMLNSFMEESNIRWGEIVGGLLIIGCSTALVVSLWSQISQIPVLKFLIFTTVTAALFGIGLYTEHRWKLPTTSRGILTIATLLVPLNFLAIAAVSGGTEPPGALVIGSELIAPAVFLCLVYFAGRVLTPMWPHLLAAGVLGSSIGQLLVRHFASPELSPSLLIALGAFPVACYVASDVWMLKKAVADREIDETETIAIFISLGALTFAAVLPFALLLYKSGPVGMTMMYLGPLVSFAGFPLLATGTLLWQRVLKKELVASRTAGTSIAILGVLVVLSGMILAWPNPASIVPAALFNFAVFTTLAVLLNIPRAHLPAAFCFGVAYIVLFHVMAGHVAWQNLRVTSLLRESLSLSSGQALAPLFVMFLVAFEWLARKRSKTESKSYLIAACVVAIVSLALVTGYGVWFSSTTHAVWLVYALYAVGAFWIASRVRRIVYSWIGSSLLLAAFAQAFAQSFSVPFPWQAAMLAHATVCAVGAVLTWQYEKDAKGTLTAALYQSALLTSFVAVVCLVQAGKWETTAMQAERVFWLAGIWLVLLWLVRRRVLLAAFQIALTCAVVLAVKALLQQYEWYAYLPHAFLHPWALQIQGTVLILLVIGWSAVRFAVKSATSDKLKFVEHLVDSRWAIDRLVSWVVLVGFVLLAIYGALPGVTRELMAQGVDNPGWNIAGFPHQEAFSVGSWILLGLLVLAMLANAWERRRAVYVLGAVVALSTICPLLAGRFETDIATASAWRWLGALFLLAASLPILFRDPVFAWLRSFGWPQTDISDTELARRIRLLLLASTLGPLVILTAYPALRAIYYMPVHGPASGFFHFLDDSFSYGAPLVIVAMVMIGYAVCERLPVYAFAAGLFFNITVTMWYLLSVVAVNGSMNRVVFAQAIQLNAITAAIYALVWLRTRSRWLDQLAEPKSTTAQGLLRLQVGIAIAINALLIAPVAVRLVLQPGLTGIGTMESGSLSGWAAFLLTVVAAAWFAKAYHERLTAGALCSFLTGVACLAAFTAARWEAGNWMAFHTLIAATATTAWLMCLVRSAPSRLEATGASGSFPSTDNTWFDGDWEWGATLCATTVGAVTVLLALRGAFSDPTGAAWSIAALLAMSALATALNWQTYEQLYLFAAGILFNGAVSLWWYKYLSDDLSSGLDFICLNVVAMGLTSILWLWLELRSRGHRVDDTKSESSLHHFAALGALSCMSIVLFMSITDSAKGLPDAQYSYWLGWLALASSTALMIACLWDPYAKYAAAGIYVLGLFTTAMALLQLSLPPRSLAWSGMMTMAIYTIGASLLWRSREKVIEFADVLKIPRRMDPSATELKWLAVFNTLLVTIVLLLAYWVVLRFADSTSRSTAALALTGQALTFALLAEGARRAKWQRAAIALFVTGMVFVGWAWLIPGATGTWLNRAVILMVEMFAFVGLYALGLNRALKQETDWTKAARACMPWIAGTGVVALLFALSTEVFYQINFGAVRINPLSLIAIGATLVAGIVICVLFALSPKHDPLNLSERGRMNYVYAGEVMLGLLFMHIRLTMPWLFTGFFERYWPFVVMAIAYSGVVTSEALRRRQVRVLAQPIERTGAFLPLLPVIGFWVIQSKVDFSALLFVVGGIYGLLSILRRSFAFGLLAAIAGNGGLWYLLHRTDNYQLLQHPQLWLIPVALSVLMAAYLNEDDFTEDQMAGIRYMSLVTIYASSTADIFINGVADSPWLPLVLAALSLAGVFCGILFRIRGLLLLGCVFLLIAIITMIWYASVNLGWTWLWYVAGIATGATIIFMFALFEKKRAEVLRVVEGLKDWER